MFSNYAAHIDRNGKTQSVKEHSLNVSVLSKKYTKDIGTESIGELAGIMHDAGKLTKEFNEYIYGQNSLKRGDLDHSYAGARYLCELADMIDKDRHYNVSRFIAHIIISHHGLHDWVDEDCKDYLDHRISVNMLYEQIKMNIGQIANEEKLVELLEKAEEEYRTIRKQINSLSRNNDKLNKTEFAFYMGLFERLMQSALVDADRNDTADFMAGKELGKEFDTAAIWEAMQEKITEKLKRFSINTDAISRQRMNISDRCAAFADHKVGICRLIVPTGGGKTLSSLRFAIEYCNRFKRKKIFYIAPFMSILEQNSDEIRAISGDEFFIEHHSDAISGIDSDEELHEYELRTERWDTPVIATTMVQFLNVLFSGKMSSVRRMHTLCDSVIIIDEIQSLPRKCVHMFDLAMNFLSEICGSTVVLCSATQPPLEDMRFKLHIDKQGSMTDDWEEDFRVFARTEIIPIVTDYGMDYKEAAGFCAEKFFALGNLLVIVNTKAAAKALYERLSEKVGEHGEVVHLSTNMCPEHRRKCIDHIRNSLDQQKPVVCVTTQLIEAGVDISFRCVVRSLAGLENAAQAAGRCNRHGLEEGICPVYLIKLKEESLNGLKEIKDSQLASMQILYSHKDDEIDLQDPEILTEYFRTLYDIEKSLLSYNVEDIGMKTTLINLLSLNNDRYEMSPKTESPYSVQAFKTAGSLFEVIDSNTINVIVPFNDEAEKIIEILDTDSYDPMIFRKAQKYLIGIYTGVNKKLTEYHALRPLQSGAYALVKEYYDEETGLITDGAVKETLIF